MSNFIPRTTADGIYQNPMYYDPNSGYYDMPNCTQYAYGRAWEILGTRQDKLRYLGDAKQWWGDFDRSYFKYGQEPKLGAIACWDDDYGAGHVAVVEHIGDDGIFMSESRYHRPIADYPPDTEHYFDYTRYNPNTKRLTWMSPDLVLQGFIYILDEPAPPTLNVPVWLLFKFRERR